MHDQVPAGWRKEKFGSVFDFIKGKKPSQLYDEPAKGRVKYLIVDSITGNGIKYADEKEGVSCDQNDLLIIADGSRSGHLFTGLQGMVSSTFLVIKPRKHLAKKKFMFYQLSSLGLTKKEFRKGGAIPHFDYSKLKSVEGLFPPEPEQDKIAEILTTVDENIEETDKIIADCERIKKGMMQTLLTRGIPNRHKKFKQTEIGEIPEDWGLKQLQEVATISGRVGWKGYTVSDLRDSGALALGANNISKNNRLDLTATTHLSQEKYLESPEIMVRKGDLLVVQRGSLGKIALVDRDIGEATINPSMILVKNIKIDGRFLFYALCNEPVQKEIRLCQSQTGVPMISQKQCKEFMIPIPSIEEQKEISKILADIDERILLEEEKKLQLESTKQALMQKLLSGELRVKVD